MPIEGGTALEDRGRGHPLESGVGLWGENQHGEEQLLLAGKVAGGASEGMFDSTDNDAGDRKTQRGHCDCQNRYWPLF